MNHTLRLKVDWKTKSLGKIRFHILFALFASFGESESLEVDDSDTPAKALGALVESTPEVLVYSQKGVR
ncbi:MAG: hypothetical protein A1D16_19040 [Flavihumibacter sp. CACIAM 22H1]|nr:MAG: hypothetical protein A1D16_19040 [Flavihumibacter sp. CACIAM 22H1]